MATERGGIRLRKISDRGSDQKPARDPLVGQPEPSTWDHAIPELTAIVRGLEILALRDGPGSRFRIFTDSQAAMQRLRSDNSGPGQSLARRGILLAQAIVSWRQSSVSVHWVPGHSGVEGSEMADLCVGKAASKTIRAGPDTGPGRGVSLAFLKAQRSERTTAE